jgi:hypothetical protein
MDVPNQHIMSRKGRLVGAGVLGAIGASSLVLAQFPGLGPVGHVGASHIVPVWYVIALLSLISALGLSLYISPEEHLWGSEDPPCDRDVCRHARH